MAGKFFILFLTAFNSGCSKMDEESSALYKFNGQFGAKIYKEYGFQLYGTGGSVPLKIEKVNLSFSTNQVANVVEARSLVISIANKMIDEMNKSKTLRPYLATYPVDYKNISLTLRFRQLSEQPDSLQSVMIIGPRNLIVYNVFNDDRTALLDYHEESFEQAVKIIGNENREN